MKYKEGQRVVCDGVLCEITHIDRDVKWHCPFPSKHGVGDVLTLWDIKSNDMFGQVLDNYEDLKLAEEGEND